MKKNLLVFLLFLSFCSKHSESQDKQSASSSPSTSIQEQLDHFTPSVPVRKITHLDIPVFLDVYISFLENQIVWLRDPASQSGDVSVESEENLDQDVQSALEAQSKQKETFFEKWGISFDIFDQFSLAHSQEIQDYLLAHPDEQKRIENLDRFLSSIQNSNASQNDEYNYKDENSIIDQTTKQEGEEENSDTTPPTTTSSPSEINPLVKAPS